VVLGRQVYRPFLFHSLVLSVSYLQANPNMKDYGSLEIETEDEEMLKKEMAPPRFLSDQRSADVEVF